MNTQQHTAQKSLGFLMLGAAVGMVGALLVAPQSGRKSRAQLAEMKDKAKTELYKSGKSLLQFGKHAHKELDEAKGRAEIAAEQTIDQATKAVERARQKSRLRGTPQAEEEQWS